MSTSLKRYGDTAWDRFVPVFHGLDEGRLAFMVGRKHKGSRRWVMFRCSVSCFETGSWGSADEAMAWGSRLTSRRPVSWEKNSTKPE